MALKSRGERAAKLKASALEEGAVKAFNILKAAQPGFRRNAKAALAQAITRSRAVME